MAFATLRTIAGYLSSFLRQVGPFDLSRKTLDGIYNYLQISDQLSTSGQPTEAQFELILDAGFYHVINLAPHSAENALPDEAGTLASLGIEYVHLPVDFKAPTEANFDKFCEQMEVWSDRKVWVHCAANMRVSAFIYRLRIQADDTSRKAAIDDLHKIWEPFGVWKDFVGETG